MISTIKNSISKKIGLLVIIIAIHISSHPLYSQALCSLHLDFKNSLQSERKIQEEQTFPPKELNKDQLCLVLGTTAVSFIALNCYLNNTYWKEGRESFYSQEDFNRYQLMDKFGYFYLSNFMTHILSASFESANIDFEETYIYGAVGAFLFGAYLEVRDGYSISRAFSLSDLAATTMGAAYCLSQYYLPVLKEIQPRMSYYPSNYLENDLDRGEKVTCLNDLMGQKYWLSFRMENLLPENIAEYWPDFLMISIGKGIKGENFSNLRSDIYLAFDIDAEAIPLYGTVWQFIKNTLNYLHFPLPGIRLTNGIAAFALCY